MSDDQVDLAVEPEVVADAPMEPTREQHAHALVYRWAIDNFSNGPVSQATEVWNAIHNALPALVAVILKDL